ncbi:MAG: trigger factor [Patescibacteria group bacterium]|jgi:trigger factor
MQVTKNQLPKGQLELTIELPAEELEKYYQTATKKVGAGIRIDGFRPGKVPDDVVIKKVGAEQIMAEACDLAIQMSIGEAIEQEKIIIISTPKIDIIKQALGNPFIYKATVSLLPTVEIGDYKSVKVKKKKVTVDPKELTKAVDDLRKMRSKEALVDREVQKGDKAEVDIEVFQNKVPIEGGQGKNQPIIIGEGNFIPGFEDNLIGMKKGETKEFELKFPKEYFQKNLAGKPAEFRIKVNGVFKIEKPEANDEFAKSFGPFKSIKDLEDQISKNLLQELENKERQRVELEMLESIADKSKFGEFPEDLVASEIDKMIHELRHDFENQGLKYEDYLQSIKKTEAELRTSFEPRAEKRVRTALLIRKVAELDKIEATEAEIHTEIDKSKKMYEQQGNDEMLKQLDSPDYHSFVKNVMVNQKVIDMLYKMATQE